MRRGHVNYKAELEDIKVQNISPKILGINLEPISTLKSANICPVLILVLL